MIRLRPGELETLLGDTHHALHAAGAAQGVWARLECTCGKPECRVDDSARHTLTLQLDALAAYWRAEEASGDDLARITAALSRLGDVLGLVSPSAHPADTGRLLHAVRDHWLAGMGTPLGGPPGESWLEELMLVEARNELLLDRLLSRMVTTPFVRLADTGAAHARAAPSRAARESRAACRRALRTWIPDHEAHPLRNLLHQHLLRVLAEAPWSAGEAREVVQMAEDAAHAVLAFGIVDDLWIAPAYGAMEQVAPFAALRVALVLEDDPEAERRAMAPAGNPGP